MIKFLAPPIFISFTLGILTSQISDLNTCFLSLLLIIPSLIISLRCKKYLLFDTLLLFSFFILGMIACRIERFSPPSDVKNFIKDKDRFFIEGVVVSDPERRIFGNYQYLNFILRPKILVNKAGVYKKLEGYLQVRYLGDKDIEYGDDVEFKGIFLKGKVFTAKSLKVKNKGLLNPLKALPYKLRRLLEKRFLRDFSFKEGAFLNALILGKRSYLKREDVEIFKDTGTMHLLAISGLHVGVIIGILKFILKFIGIKRRQRFVIMSLFLPFYCVLTGLRPSIIRASILTFFWMISFFLNRPQSLVNNLFLSAFLVLIFSPSLLFDIGFQLSYICTFFIAIFLKYIFKNKNITGYIGSLFLVSLVSFLGTFPLISFYFGKITPIGIFANIVLIPLIFLIVLFSFLYIIFLPVSFLFKDTLSLLIYLLTFFNSLFYRSNFYFDIKISLKTVLLYYSFLLLTVLSLFKNKEGRP